MWYIKKQSKGIIISNDNNPSTPRPLNTNQMLASQVWVVYIHNVLGGWGERWRVLGIIVVEEGW